MVKNAKKIPLEQQIAILKERNRQLRAYGFGNVLSKSLTALIKWGGLVMIAYYARDVLLSFSGKVTLANIKVDATGSFAAKVDSTHTLNQQVIAPFHWGDCELTVLLSLALALGFGFIAWKQTMLRKQVIKTLHPEQKLQELKADPARSSSKISKDGTTNPEDE